MCTIGADLYIKSVFPEGFSLSQTRGLEVTGRSSGGRAKSFVDVVKEGMKSAGVREEDAGDGPRSRHVIGCGDMPREEPKEEKVH